MAVFNNLSLPPLAGVVENWSISQSKLYKTNFTWTIHNFSFLCSEWNISPAFFSGINDNFLKWSLELHPNNSLYVCFNLRLLSGPSDRSKVFCKVKICILNAKGEKCHEMKLDEDVAVFTEGKFKYFPQFIESDALLGEENDLVPEDILTIFLEIDVVTNNIDFSGRKTTGQIKFTESNFSDDFAYLLNSQILSDVKLVIGEQEFPAHKAILGAKSDVFAAMFQHDMKESKSGRVIITDVKAEVLQEMLNFIYTGNSPKIEEMTHELLVAADKYSLKKLKKMCEKLLIVGLTNETAAEKLILADRYSGDLLKKETITFINNYAKDIIQTKGWGEMLVSHPALIKETLEALYTSKKRKLPIAE